MAPDLKKEFLAIKAAVAPFYDRVQKLSTALDLEQSANQEDREIDESIEEIDNQEYIDALDSLDEAIDGVASLTGD